MRGIQQYRSTAVETASNQMLLILLLESAMEKLELAFEALDQGDISQFRSHLAHVREVYSELMVSLDHEYSPDLSAKLHRLYVWCIRELARAGSSRDAEALRGVQRVTESLFLTWSKAVEDAA